MGPSRASLLGYDAATTRVAVVFETRSVGDLARKERETSGDYSWEESDNLLNHQFKRKIKKIVGSLALDSQDMVTYGIGGRFVLLKRVQAESTKSTRELLKDLFAGATKAGWQVTAGVGSRCSSLEEIPESFDQALQALEVGRIFFGPGVYYTEELGLEKLIDRVGGDFRRNFSREILGELDNLNGKSSHQLMETAMAFLQCNLNQSKTAQKLFIHRNTLLYRLRKIKEITGLDLTQV